MSADPQATVALLKERIASMGDMHGFARAIGAVLGALRGEQEKEFSMTQTVLSDPVLTQKVLRLANSGMYAAYGQRINTVTKAVLVLGTDAIGQLALGLKAIEELGAPDADTPPAHMEMEKAVLAGMVARQVAASAAAPDPEEAVVCSMLHMLGRMLVSFYLPECWSALQANGGPGFEDAAALPLLGVSMEELGRAAAGQWGLPSELVGSMRRVEPSAGGADLAHGDWLAALSTMSAQCADSLWHDDPAGAVSVRALASSFSAMLGVAPQAIMAAVETARQAASNDLTVSPLAKPAARRARQQGVTRARSDSICVLRGGVAEMRAASATATPAQLMSMALETVYQGLTLSRAVAFLRHRRDRKYRAKLGFGDGVAQRLVHMTFDDAYEPNVFHAALGSDRTIFIDNPREPAFAAKLPRWWNTTLGEARSFVILPICCNGQPAGLIYGDWDDSFPPIKLSEAESVLLNELRAMMAGSLEQRQKLEPAVR
ncbi:MAG: HDOD domain-containing protein [Pseudomonadota bacterium]